MIRKLLIVASLLSSSPLLADSINVSTTCDHCLTNQQMDEIQKQIEDLIQSNQELIKKADQLEKLQKAKPELELEPLDVIVDKEGHTFVKDSIKGKLKIGDLSYDVVIQLKNTVVKAKEEQYGFKLKFKAAVIQSYELDKNKDLKTYTSGALAIEPFHYGIVNANVVIGPRLYGPAIGVQVTEHFNILTGIGFRYDDQKAFFIGASFDF